ncbi:hypothetical protein GCM10010343_13680 [Streptomyces avidinii]|nr:hypothetical protein GCM10010343_13680 [Streptomyces avidinii]
MPAATSGPADPPAPPTRPAGPGGFLLGEPTVTRAAGMLMAMTPCTARDAHRILSAAAGLARTSPYELAAAMAAGTRGTPVPVHLERAVRRAVEAARAPVPAAKLPTALVPSRVRTEEVLTHLRACQSRLSAAPDDPDALRAMDDAAYTLCVLMGRRSVPEAVLVALNYLAVSTGGPAGTRDASLPCPPG